MLTAIPNGFRNTLASNVCISRSVQVVQKSYYVADAVFSEVDLTHKAIRGLIRIYNVLTWNHRPINPPVPPQEGNGGKTILDR